MNRSEQTDTQSKKSISSTRRLMSIDALRGFDMFWILGAEGLFAALFSITGWSFLLTLDQQMHHSHWHGLTAYDSIFPLFIFLSGVSLGFGAKRLNLYSTTIQQQKWHHAIKRLFLLLLLGIVYNHGWGTGMPADIQGIRYASVLGRIGIAWFFATLLVWYTQPKTQWLVAIAILVGYYLLLTFGQIAAFGGDYSPEKALNGWFDTNLLPGIHYQQLTIDPEGLLSNIPSVVNALIGVFVGRFMKRNLEKPLYILKNLALFSIVLLVIGYWWSLFFPLNKTLWTSSFVLVTCGYSCALLTMFYGVIDVLKRQRWCFIFTVIGMNSLVIYLLTSLVNWSYIASSLFGGLIQSLPENYHELFSILSLLLCQWLFLYWLYKRNIFIKV